ncbi:MAG: hypothetical protein J3Q66DRAFT_389868, partial [Benniella sp.]
LPLPTHSPSLPIRWPTSFPLPLTLTLSPPPLLSAPPPPPPSLPLRLHSSSSTSISSVSPSIPSLPLLSSPSYPSSSPTSSRHPTWSRVFPFLSLFPLSFLSSQRLGHTNKPSLDPSLSGHQFNRNKIFHICLLANVFSIQKEGARGRAWRRPPSP